MITTLLPKEQVDVLRSIGDAANVFMALFLIDRLYPGHSTTLRELGNLFGTDKRTIEKRLNSLCGSDRVIFDGHGYVLLEGGRALFLAAAPSLPAMPPELQSGAESLEWDTIEALAPTSPDDEQAPIEVQALDIHFNDVPPMPEMDGDLAQNVQGSEETTTRAMRALLEEEDIKSESLIKESSSIDSMSTQNARTQPTTLQILDATSLLFEKTMTTSGIADKPRRVAIGWVAQAWDQRKFLRSPQGLIYKRLSADPVQMPQEKYYDHPRKYLPESYLVAIGLMVPRAVQGPIILAPQVAEPEAEPGPVDALDDMPVDQAAVQAWEKVLERLQSEMHRAPFEAWVRDTRGIRFDRNGLVVGTKSTIGREWLESRIRKTAERMLVGILARSVAVVFVVSQGD